MYFTTCTQRYHHYVAMAAEYDVGSWHTGVSGHALECETPEWALDSVSPVISQFIGVCLTVLTISHIATTANPNNLHSCQETCLVVSRPFSCYRRCLAPCAYNYKVSCMSHCNLLPVFNRAQTTCLSCRDHVSRQIVQCFTAFSISVRLSTHIRCLACDTNGVLCGLCACVRDVVLLHCRAEGVPSECFKARTQHVCCA